MAVNYTNLFEDIGKLVKLGNQLHNLATGSGSPVPDLSTLYGEIETVWTGNSNQDKLQEISEGIDSLRDNIVSDFVGFVEEQVERRLTDQTTVVRELGLGSRSGVTDVLRELYRDMVDNSQSVAASVVTVGSPAADAGNGGDGSLVVDKLLDGVSVPGSGLLDNREHSGIDSQLAVTSETLTVECVNDQQSGGLVEGSEQFRVTGRAIEGNRFVWDNESSDTDLTFSTLNASSIVSNRDFEDWASNVPSSWTIDSGSAGFQVFRETTTVFRGSGSLQMAGDALTAIQLSQPITRTLLQSRKKYMLAVMIQTNGVTAGDLTIQFESPSGGYTAAGTEKITMNAAALAAATSWSLQTFCWVTPDVIPDDLELVIKTTAALDGDVFVDSLAFSPVVWAGGVSLSVLAGAAQFVKGDRFTVTVSNDNAGVFQTWFRRQFGFQLPTSGTPSQADSLAT